MLCPKCQRPIVDERDDAGALCCAHASVQWRCALCAKIVPGFAFAYGSCPHCGGALELLDGPRSSEPAALAGIRMAFEIELGARAFYQRAAAESADPALRELFMHFAVMEGTHMETLARRYHVDVPAPSQAFSVELAAIFAGVEHRPSDPENLFRIATAWERRAAEFFAERAAGASAGSAEQTLYRELATEEVEHARWLMTAHERWRSGHTDLFPGDQAHGAAAAQGGTMNAAALLLEGHDGTRTALVCGEQSLSYAALRDYAARVASALCSRGVRSGDRVAIKLPDGLDWVGAYLGTIWAGAVAVAVNPRIPAPEWQYILDEAGFRIIVAESADDTPPPWADHVLRLEEWRAAVDAAAPLAPVAMAPDAPAFWCHSSGTSGKPKAVVHSQRFAQRIEQVSREGLGIGADDRLFASSKLFFSYPQTNSLCAGLKLGATVLLDPQWPTAQSVAASVRALRPSVLFCVPSLYRNLLHEGLAPAIAGAGVRLCVSAGEALPASLREAWREQTGLTIVDGYGASEVLILVMLDHGDGQGFMPSPGVDVQPIGDAQAGAPSRLAIRAPTLALGYLDRPQAQAETFRDGELFCPADLFRRNEAGGWGFAGREDSLVKIRGRWVNLVELEQQLVAKAPGILEAAAVCVPDGDGVDSVALFFVTRDAAAADAALRSCADRLPPHQRPRWLHPVAALPRTPTGKLLRRKLQELHRTLA